MSRPTPVIAFALLAATCGRSERDQPQPTTDASPTIAPEPDPNAVPWRFLPTFVAGLSESVVAEPLLELTLPHAARLHIVAAVAERQGDARGRIELRSYRQHADGIEPEGPGEPILRLTADAPRADALPDLLTQLAAPGNALLRPLGLDVADGNALVAELTRAAQVVRNPRSGGAAVVVALRTLVRGLGNPIVFERDDLGRTIDALVAGEWTPTADKALSDRRIEITTRDARTLEVVRATRGWAVADVRAAPPT